MIFYLWVLVALSSVLGAPAHSQDSGRTDILGHAEILGKTTFAKALGEALGDLGKATQPKGLGISTHPETNQHNNPSSNHGSTQPETNQHNNPSSNHGSTQPGSSQNDNPTSSHDVECLNADFRRKHEAQCATLTTSSSSTKALVSSTTSTTHSSSTAKSSAVTQSSSSTIKSSSATGTSSSTTRTSSVVQPASTSSSSSSVLSSSQGQSSSTRSASSSFSSSSVSSSVTTSSVIATSTSSSISSSANSSSTTTSAASATSTASCVNSASDRSCWGEYNISTNYYDIVPNTGVTREYWFSVDNVTAAPDGVERLVLAVNGSIPGPTIIADWGDEIVVHVTNNMANNGSTIHWHGIRQNYTNYMDGVPSVTQCPIAPGDTQTYKWRAVQYGSSWYHSHFSVQAWDGVFGGILINGPATADYDEDLGHVFLNDWSHQSADVLALQASTTGPPTSPNCLINGTNTWTEDDGTVVGSRFETNFVAGTRYRIRLVNGAADTHFRFTIDNHTLEVIANDFVPIVPYTTTDLSIGMGQRYDIIVTATETTGDFWIRAIPQESCSDNSNANNILGIVRYDSSSTADPTSAAYSTLIDSCVDEASSDLVPYLAMDIGTVSSEDDEVADLAFGTTIKWTMNAVSFVSEWDYPTVLAISEGNDTWTTAEHVWSLPNANEWVKMIIQTDFAQAHPIHLHGHDFWVLGSGTGTYSNTTTLQTVEAPRRDVAMLPADGWLALAWKTDNPGAWIMHCHIAWHAAEGFALQLVERESEINALQDNAYIKDTCKGWNDYVAADDIVQDDSGI